MQNTAVNAPITFEEIVMVMINCFIREKGYFKFVNVFKRKDFEKSKVWHSIVPAISKEHAANTSIQFSFNFM